MSRSELTLIGDSASGEPITQELDFKVGDLQRRTTCERQVLTPRLIDDALVEIAW